MLFVNVLRLTHFGPHLVKSLAHYALKFKLRSVGKFGKCEVLGCHLIDA